MNCKLEEREKNVAIPLKNPILKKTIKRSMLLHALIVFLLLTMLTLTKVSDNLTPLLFSDFVFMFLPFMLLLAVPLFIMANSLREARGILRPTERGFEFLTWGELMFDKKKLDANALSTILPTIYSSFDRLFVVKRFLVYSLYLFVLLPLFSHLLSKSSALYVITLLLYAFMCLRYVRCLGLLPSCNILLSDECISLPELGFFKLSYRKIPFEEIRYVEIVEHVNHKKNIHLTAYGKFVEDHDKCWIEGMRIQHKKQKLTLSLATVSFDFLCLLNQLLIKHKIKTTKLKV